MIRVKVQIQGDKLMMHRMSSDIIPKQGQKKIAKDDFEAQAKVGAYMEDNGSLYIPNEWIKGVLCGTSKYFKQKQGTPPLRNLIAGLVQINPEHIPLNKKEYKVDIRNVHNFKAGRFPVGRAVVEGWKASFTIEWNPSIIALLPNSIKEILTMGGQIIGIGAYRPEHLGNFGRYEITKWEEEEF